MAYAAYGAGVMTIDHDNIIKLYSVSPSMLGRGHMLFEPQGPVWVSEYDDPTHDERLMVRSL